MEHLPKKTCQNGISYTLVGDYYIPDLQLPEENRPIGIWGRMHKAYLEQCHPVRYIYTFNADLKRRLAEFSRKYPQLCRLERSTTEGSVTYVLDKSRLSIRLVPPYSEERLAAAREYAKQHGFQVLRTDKKSA